MEFNFSINALFKENFVKVKSNLIPENHMSDRRGDGDMVTKVSTVLDKMGIVSAKAQNLRSPITSASKLRNSDHTVYIMTDAEGNRGHGTVVGILKVGSKKLFIYDLSGVQWEMEPLCVLDFYVHESKQRTGCGRMLFDYMLRDQQMRPSQLALDQPSDSFFSFMAKHYGLDKIIPQINSFVIYDDFFTGRSDKGRHSSTNGANSEKNKHPIQSVKALSRSGELPSYGRHSAKKAGCTMAEYMQDPSLISQNGNRQSSAPTNQSSPAKTSANQLYSTGEAHRLDTQAQVRPTSLPEKLNGPSSASASYESSHASEYGTDIPDASGDAPHQNGSTLPSPEEVPGKLDLKFHHTHLCEYTAADLWSNHHGAPLAQYGHYWSSVGGLLSEDQTSETDGEVYQNGNGSKHMVRKISNIPIGEGSSDDDDDELPRVVSPVALNTNQNGHPFPVGTNGTRDVRIKKTMFQNLSPYRK